MRNINEGYLRRQSAKLEKKISHREYQERLSGTVGEKLVADLYKNTKAQNVPVSHRLELMKEAFFRHNMKSSKMWL